MKRFSTALTTELTKTQISPVEILDVFPPDQPLGQPMIRLVRAERNIVWAGHEYVGFPYSREAVQTSVQGLAAGVGLGIDNASLLFVKGVNMTLVTGCRIQIKKIFRNLSTPTDFILLFDGQVDNVSVGVNTIRVTAISSIEALNILSPKRVYQTRCNHRWGDNWCGIDATREEHNLSGTAASNSTTTEIYDAQLLLFPDEYWDAGWIRMDDGPNKGLIRPTLSFDNKQGKLTTRFPFPVTLAGRLYTVRRGCKKNKSDCRLRYNNLRNYGGYAEIPMTPVIT